MSEPGEAGLRDLEFVAPLHNDQSETVDDTGDGETRATASELLTLFGDDMVLHLLQHRDRIGQRLPDLLAHVKALALVLVTAFAHDHLDERKVRHVFDLRNDHPAIEAVAERNSGELDWPKSRPA